MKCQTVIPLAAMLRSVCLFHLVFTDNNFFHFLSHPAIDFATYRVHNPISFFVPPLVPRFPLSFRLTDLRHTSKRSINNGQLLV